MVKKTNRRDFLTDAATALPIIPLTAAKSDAAANDETSQKFQPESFWRDRMKAPGDGKKYGWFVDTRRCFGCHGCEVSCKAENDVPLGNYIRQTIYKDVGEYPKVARMFLPMSCQHCEDAPCIKACPCGALHKESGGTVAVDVPHAHEVKLELLHRDVIVDGSGLRWNVVHSAFLHS